MRARRWLLFGAIWTLVALLFAAQSLLYSLRDGRPFAASVAIASSLQYWYIWGVLAPGVVHLTRRFPIRRAKWPTRALAHAAFAVLFAATHVLLRGLSGALLWSEGVQFAGIFVEQFHLNVVVYVTIAGVTHAWLYHNLAVQEAADSARLAASLSEARLEALTAQLEPHFVFNTLQAASSLVYTDAAAADRMLIRLSELLRRVLRARAQPFATLAEELSFLEHYIEIVKTRFGDRLQYAADVDPALLDARVPSLLLQPLVENAVKHGISKRPGTGRIVLSVKPAERNSLTLSVTDDGPGFADAADGEGIGLRNTRERLRHLFGDDFRLELDPAPGGGLAVTVRIPAGR